MKKIKNIIFDLGGIFIELDYFKTERAFIDLGVTDFSKIYTQHYATPLFRQLETGQIKEKEFYDAFRVFSFVELRDDQIRDAWNAMLLHFPLERLEWLNNIRRKFPVYLFSNTNIIHYNAVLDIYKRDTGKQNFNEYFIKAYYSHDLGLRKPDREGFEVILKRESLIADETLFIDDTPKNIEGAKQVGLQTLLLQLPQTVLDLQL
jgi:putative hydrolase of the HAD superfamily